MLNLHLLEYTLKAYDHISDLLLAKYWVITGCKHRNCVNLTLINIDDANTTYTANSGALYSKDIKTLICCPSGATTDIPDSVTKIDDYAFESCLNMPMMMSGDIISKIFRKWISNQELKMQ